MSDNSKPVYSTAGGQLCPECGKPLSQCGGHLKKSAKGSGRIRVSRETKGRKGKAVTLITGLPLHPGGLEDVAKTLKQRCGTGGTVKHGTIEIQGDKRDQVVELLNEMGYKAKRSGG